MYKIIPEQEFFEQLRTIPHTYFMSKIYTKTGDRGKTSLFDGTRVDKDNIRIEAYGTIDELNSVIGVVCVIGKTHKKIGSLLQTVQNDLFAIGAHLANPSGTYEKKFIAHLDSKVFLFEKAIDDMTEKLPVLTNFILPGGGLTGSHIHLARTVARRAERTIVALAQQEEVDGSVIRYLNRLSDLLFTISRFVNFLEKKKETIWKKGI